jgi:hypothetical protein
MEMRDKKLKNAVNTELEDNKYDTLADDHYFEFLKTEFNKEMQSFWKLLEREDKE